MGGYISGAMSSGGGAYCLKISTISGMMQSGNSSSKASMIASAALRCPPPVSENKNSTRALSGCGGWLMRSFGNEGFQPAGQLPARQENAPATGQAFQAYICA